LLPTILTGVPADMKVVREETFGPVAPLFRFETEEQVVEMAKETEFGLASYFFSKDISKIFRFAEALEFCMVGINTGLISTEVAPFWRHKAIQKAERDPSTGSTNISRSSTSASAFEVLQIRGRDDGRASCYEFDLSRCVDPRPLAKRQRQNAGCEDVVQRWEATSAGSSPGMSEDGRRVCPRCECDRS
jgi:hypothetical protein